jgi:hypothetical protein
MRYPWPYIVNATIAVVVTLLFVLVAGSDLSLRGIPTSAFILAVMIALSVIAAAIAVRHWQISREARRRNIELTDDQKLQVHLHANLVVIPILLAMIFAALVAILVSIQR